jgi:hypothetical protein
MSAIQTSFSERQRAWLVGQVVDMRLSSIISKTVEGASGVAPGTPVARGAADEGVVVPTSTKVTIGVVVRSTDLRPASPNVYAQYESAQILVRGRIAVLCSDSGGVTPGEPVYVVPTTGLFRADNTGSAIQIPGATWETTTANGEVGVIELRD